MTTGPGEYRNQAERIQECVRCRLRKPEPHNCEPETPYRDAENQRPGEPPRPILAEGDTANLLGLLKFQRHAVAFADRFVFRALFVAQLERRRQSPHPFGVIASILRIRVQLRFFDQSKAGRFGERDYVRFVDVAAPRFRILFYRRIAACSTSPRMPPGFSAL